MNVPAAGAASATASGAPAPSSTIICSINSSASSIHNRSSRSCGFKRPQCFVWRWPSAAADAIRCCNAFLGSRAGYIQCIYISVCLRIYPLYIYQSVRVTSIGDVCSTMHGSTAEERMGTANLLYTFLHQLVLLLQLLQLLRACTHALLSSSCCMPSPS